MPPTVATIRVEQGPVRHTDGRMTVRRNARVAPALILAVAGGGALAMLAVGDVGLLYLAPAFVLALLLSTGRYVGEDQIAALHEQSARRRRGAAAAPRPLRSVDRLLCRGGSLVGSSLAKRPPPVARRLVVP